MALRCGPSAVDFVWTMPLVVGLAKELDAIDSHLDG
jgi:hypothetical protein